MTTKGMAVLVGAAAVLGAVAWSVSGGARLRPAQLNGRRILPDLRVAEVASIEVGDSLRLLGDAGGWRIESMHGYPADRSRIAENLLRLTELKVGQVARGRKLGQETALTLKGGDGRVLASLRLGDLHYRKATGEMAMYGGYPDGRYLAFGGETVLVADPLDAFGGDPKAWCDAKIADGVYFTSVADPALTEAELGFATGQVCKVTLTEGTNRVEKAAKVGNKVKDGSDRYFRLDGDKWIFTIAPYTAESLTKPKEL